MSKTRETEEQLINELAEAHARIAELEASEAEHKRAEEALERRAAQLAILQEASATIASRLTLEEIFDAVVQSLSEILGYRLIGIYLMEGRILELKAQVGYGSPRKPSTVHVPLHVPLEEGVVGRTARTGQPQLVTNVEEDPDFVADVAGITSEVCVPLKRGDEVLGVLNVESDRADKPLDAFDLQLVTLLSNHIVIALENARLYETVQQELTERKQAEEALQASEERFALAVQGTNDGIWDWDIANNTLYWSPRLKELFGYAEHELDVDFDTFDSLLHPDDKEYTGPALEAHLKDRVPYDVEHRMRTKSGEYRWFRVRGQAIWDEDGQPLRMAGSTTDITELKQTQETLQKAYEEVEKQVEERTAELKRETAERERLQQEIIETQKRALQELSTPIIPIMERIIVMPLIGSIDTIRAKDIMRALLAGIRNYRAKVVILDITGVPIVDSGVANHLNKTIQAARLKGAQTIVTGVSDAVAEAVVDLGIDWSGVETLSDLRTGLMVALAKMGRRIEG